jgi:hypothetical protein
METFYVASGVGCATEEETAARSVQLGLKPVPSGESWTRAEAVEATEKLVFNLVTSRRNIHEASPGKVVQGPQSCDWENGGSLSGKACASGGRLIPGFVVQENLALPVVEGFNAEDRICENQD